MSKKVKTALFATFLTFLAGAALWICAPYTAKQALGECFRPTTLRMMPFPEGCVPTGEKPPANLMQIVEDQKKLYHLAVQQVVVCRTANRLPQGEPYFAKGATGEEIRKRWLPLYAGCCSYQFRRHVAVVVVKVYQSGSVLVQAAWVQSRWDYLTL